MSDKKARKKGEVSLENVLPLRADTKLTDILAAYPWLKEEAMKLDKRFQMLDSPLGKMLLKKATISDASRYTGFGVEEIIAQITQMIAHHGA